MMTYTYTNLCEDSLVSKIVHRILQIVKKVINVSESQAVVVLFHITNHILHFTHFC